MKYIYILLVVLAFVGCNNKNKSSEPGDSDVTGTATTEQVTGNGQDGSSTTTDNPKTDNAGDPSVAGTGEGTQLGTSDGGTATGEVPGSSTPNAPDPGGSSEPGGLSTTGLNPSRKGFGTGDDTIVYVGIFAQWRYKPGELYDGTYDTARGLFVFCSNQHCQPVDIKQIRFPDFGTCDTSLSDRIKAFRIKDSTYRPVGNGIRVVGNKGYIQLGNGVKEIALDPRTINHIKKVSEFKKISSPAVQPKLQKEVRRYQQEEKPAASTDPGIIIKDRIEVVDKKPPTLSTQVNKVQTTPVIEKHEDIPLKEAKAIDLSSKQTSEPVIKKMITPDSEKVAQHVSKDTAKAINTVKPGQNSKLAPSRVITTRQHP